jgi:hypothetical protein
MSTSTQGLPASFNPFGTHPFTSFSSPPPPQFRAQETLSVTNPGFAAALGYTSPTNTPLSSPASSASSSPGSPKQATPKRAAAPVRPPVFELYTPTGRASPEPRLRNNTQTWGLPPAPSTPKRK